MMTSQSATPLAAGQPKGTTVRQILADSDKENAPAASSKSTIATPKRKSDAMEDAKNDKLFPNDKPDISEDDPRLYEISPNADTIRNKIRIWIDSGAQRVSEFQDTIGVSASAYNAFMRGNGPKAGRESMTYERAGVFFRRRQLQGLPQRLPASVRKKVKPADKTKAESQLLGVPADIELPGEKEGAVPVYETCDTMRRQIRALLKKDGITQAAYLRAITKCIPGQQNIQPRVLRDFLSHRGPAIGCKSQAFYGSYVFFEKRRIKEGKPKSKFRQEMERCHGDKGMDIEHDPRTSRLILHNSQDAFRDKYGKLHITPLRR